MKMRPMGPTESGKDRPDKGAGGQVQEAGSRTAAKEVGVKHGAYAPTPSEPPLREGQKV